MAVNYWAKIDSLLHFSLHLFGTAIQVQALQIHPD